MTHCNAMQVNLNFLYFIMYILQFDTRWSQTCTWGIAHLCHCCPRWQRLMALANLQLPLLCIYHYSVQRILDFWHSGKIHVSVCPITIADLHFRTKFSLSPKCISLGKWCSFRQPKSQRTDVPCYIPQSSLYVPVTVIIYTYHQNISSLISTAFLTKCIMW